MYDSYDSYGSWNNGSRVVHLVNCISLGRLRVFWVVHLVDYISLGRFRVYSEVHDPHDSYYSYRSWNNGSRVVQLVNCISLGRLRVYSDVHDPHDSYVSYGSWNNGSRVDLSRFAYTNNCNFIFTWNDLCVCMREVSLQYWSGLR